MPLPRFIFDSTSNLIQAQKLWMRKVLRAQKLLEEAEENLNICKEELAEIESYVVDSHLEDKESEEARAECCKDDYCLGNGESQCRGKGCK